MDRINAEVFVTIVKLGSLSRAAEKLGYTKAGISYIVNNMEETAGFKIFEREYGGVRLTPEGEELLPAIRNLLSSELALTEQMERIKGIETGRIRLISFNSVIVCWMPEILRTFKEKYPGIDIELSSCEGPEEGIRLIRDGDADCGFLATDRAEEIEVFRIKDEEDVAVVSLDHPMAERDVFPISEMQDHPFIGYSEGEAPFFGTDTLDTQTLYSIRLYCYGTVGMTREWLLTDNITPSETIVEMMFNSMPDNLRKIFFANQKAGE